MGIKGSKIAQSDDSGFLLVEEIPKPEILFDPQKSWAVCAGVGQYLNMRQQLSGTPTWDKDTQLMHEALTNSLCFPSDNVTVLNSLPTSRPATACNIEDSLKLAAANIGPEGILLFSFSGHVSLAKGALLPADYVEGNENLITVDRIVKALASLKKNNRQVVIILDCSFAANVANELKTGIGMEGFQVCSLAACSAVERSYSFPSLGGSLFTFFLHTILSRAARSGCLPVGAILKFCRPVCNAVAGLMLKAISTGDRQLVEASMTPTVATNNFEARPIDETDGSDSGWVKDIKNWLQTKVEHLKVLTHVKLLILYLRTSCSQLIIFRLISI